MVERGAVSELLKALSKNLLLALLIAILLPLALVSKTFRDILLILLAGLVAERVAINIIREIDRHRRDQIRNRRYINWLWERE